MSDRPSSESGRPSSDGPRNDGGPPPPRSGQSGNLLRQANFWYGITGLALGIVSAYRVTEDEPGTRLKSIVGLVAGFGCGLYCLCKAFLAGPPAWKEFTSAEGGFRVLMQGEPKHETVRDSPVPVQKFMVAREDRVYGVNYRRDAGADMTDLTAEHFLKIVPAKLGGEAKVLRDQAITLGEHPGREFLYELPDGTYCRTRTYLVKDRLYQVTLVAGNVETLNDAEARTFTDSFQLLE
jgi:hypothetical protein